MIRRALAIGFTLDELREVLFVRDQGGAPCRRVRDLAAGKLEAIEERLKELIVLRGELRATLKEWDIRLAKTPGNKRFRLLENLNPPEVLRPKRGTHFTTTIVTKKGPKKK
jgi:hypothetical protein